MTIVRSQKELNSVISTSLKNLKDLGLPVKRRDLEKSLSPALSGGMSHEVLSANLKSRPKSPEAIAAKYLSDLGMSHDLPNKFIQSLTSLAEQSNRLMKYGNQMKAYQPSFIEAFENGIAKAKHNEEVKFLKDWLHLFSDNQYFDSFEFTTNSYKEEDENGNEVDCVTLELSMNKGSLSFAIEVALDLKTCTVLEVLNTHAVSKNQKNPFENCTDYSIEEQIAVTLLKGIGVNCEISNEFNTNFSPELLMMMLDECGASLSRSAENRASKLKQREVYIQEYESASKWREAWKSLMNNNEVMRKKYSLQTQLEYIESRAVKANNRVGKAIEKIQALDRTIRN